MIVFPFILIYFYMILGILGPLVVIFCSIGIYLSLILNKEVKKLDAQRREVLDQKSRIVSDAIISIKNIKFNCWEDIIMEKLTELRKKDNSLLMRNFVTQGVSTTIVSTIPTLIGLAIVFSVKMFLDKEISVETVYIILLYLNQPKKNLIYVNMGLIELNSALISMKRIRCFLRIKSRSNGIQTEEEKEMEKKRAKYQENTLEAVRLSDCCFKWTNQEYKRKLVDLQKENKSQEGEQELGGMDTKSQMCLKNIDFSIRKG